MAHMHYKGTGKVHSFRGLLDHGGQDKISIQGSVGAIAWRITKFEIMGDDPQAFAQESVVKVYREEQSTIDGLIDFNANELLAAAVHKNYAGVDYNMNTSVIFDNSLFTRNIWVTQTDEGGGTRAANYYIELEEVKVSAAGMAQLAVAAARRTETA